MALLFSEGRGITDLCLEKGESFKVACEGTSAKCVSRCASRGHTYFNAGGHKGDLYYYSLGGRLLGSLDNSSKTLFYLTDALGSVLASFSNVANSATIKGNQVSGPYGNPRDFQGSINTAKGFSEQYNDSFTVLFVTPY